MQLIRAFWTLLEGDRGAVFLALSTQAVSVVIGLAFPAATKIALDYILTDNPGPSGIPAHWGLPEDRATLLWMLGWSLVGLLGLSIVVGMWGRWQMTRLMKRVQARSRRRAFEKASRLPLHRVHQIKSGGVASLIRDDAAGAGELIFHMVFNPWRALVQLVGTLAVLAWVDWKFLVGAVALMPIVWFTHELWNRRIRPLWKDIRATRLSIDARNTEVFGGMRVVRAFARERSEAARFVASANFLIRQEMLTWWRSRTVELVWQSILRLASVGVLVYGGLEVLRGRLTIGDVMMFSAYLHMLLTPLETLAATASEMQTHLAGLDRYLDLRAEKTELAAEECEGAAGRELALVTRAGVRGRVTLEGVSFRYPGGAADVLSGISLEAAAGETIALVGPSGAGKTTLCNLVARFFDPTQGAVLLDGRDLREIDVRSYRALLGVVEQDVFLFDGTVGENIRYARPDASRDAVRHAAQVANAAQFIERLEKGYDTIIGERGVRLSGGQKQRIAIARAVLADPRILILDEATSNLDTESERLIQASLTRLMENRTSFVIAHRLSTIRHADRIAVMEDGRIVETGSHEELLELNGRYAELLRLQTGEDEPAGAGDGVSASL